jgi:hypothetical protein
VLGPVIDDGLPTRLAAAISFGAYRPATVYARKPSSNQRS